jgi:Family of unknown function (DUF6230)
VKDTQGNLVLGRTRWRRFAAVAIPGGLIAAGLFAGVAAGAVPISINISGQSFKVSADKLHGDGFAQYPGVAPIKKGGGQPVAVSRIQDAKLWNMCQSVTIPGTKFVLVIHAGGDDGEGPDYAQAHDLVIGMDNLQGDATFTTIDIGVDASEAKKGSSTNAAGAPGDFGQQADEVDILNLRQQAYSTQAGTFTLKGLDMRLNNDGKECPTS